MTASRRILIVEDSPEDRAAVRWHLARDGRRRWEFREHDTGAQALAACRADVPDGIILDYGLPDMTGLEFLDRMNEEFGTMPAPVIMLTGSGGGTVAAAAIKAGAQGYLPKGELSADTLIQTLDGACERFFLLRERERQRQLLAETNQTLTMALAAAEAGAWSWDIATGAIRWSPENYRLYGLDPANGPPRYEDWASRIHPDDRDRARREVAAVVDGTSPEFRCEFRVLHPERGERWLLGLGRVERDPSGRPTRMSGINLDITTRKRAEAARRVSEERLTLALDASGTGVWDWNPITDAVTWSKQAFAIHGMKTFAGTGEAFFRLVHPADVGRVKATVEKAIAERVTYEAEFRVVRPSGEVRWVRNLGRVFDGALGEPARMLGTIMDITAQKQQEEHVQLLLREVNHRAKNMLSVVQSVARHTVATGSEDFVRRFTERIRALAANQDLLVKNDWRGVDLGELVRSQLAHFKDLVAARIEIAGPPLRLNASAAQSIGMALHELATNAGKYGALSNATGSVTVAWGVTRTGDGDGRFTMSWIERDGPPVAPPTRKGFGATVVGPMVEMGLQAEVRLDYAASGLEWHVACRAARALDATAAQ